MHNASKRKRKTTKKKSGAKPTNPALYARVKAEAKRKFKVYPSAYANGWLVRTWWWLSLMEFLWFPLVFCCIVAMIGEHSNPRGMNIFWYKVAIKAREYSTNRI